MEACQKYYRYIGYTGWLPDDTQRRGIADVLR